MRVSTAAPASSRSKRRRSAATRIARMGYRELYDYRLLIKV